MGEAGGTGTYMGVEPKIGVFSPEMDGENNGTPYEQMDDLGGKPPIFGNTTMGRPCEETKLAW